MYIKVIYHVVNFMARLHVFRSSLWHVIIQ